MTYLCRVALLRGDFETPVRLRMRVRDSHAHRVRPAGKESRETAGSVSRPLPSAPPSGAVSVIASWQSPRSLGWKEARGGAPRGAPHGWRRRATRLAGAREKLRCRVRPCFADATRASTSYKPQQTLAPQQYFSGSGRGRDRGVGGTVNITSIDQVAVKIYHHWAHGSS